MARPIKEVPILHGKDACAFWSAWMDMKAPELAVLCESMPDMYCRIIEQGL